MNQIRYCHDCPMERPLTSDRCLHCGGHRTVVTTSGSMGWSIGFLDKRPLMLLVGLIIVVGVMPVLALLSG